MIFTEKSVAKIVPPKGDVTIWDDATKGFGIRFNNTTIGTWTIKYRVAGKQRKMTFGNVGKVTLADAKIAAQKAFLKIAEGLDPAAEKAKAKAEVLADKAENFRNLIPDFLAELAVGNPGREPRGDAYIKAIKRSLEVLFSDFHELRIGDVSRAMVIDAMDEIAEENGWRRSGTAQAHLSSFYAYCQRRKGYEGRNPVDGTERRNAQKGTRVHSESELRLIWQATEKPTRYNRIVRLLMLTGVRKTVIGSLRTAEVDLDKAEINVGIEAGKAKNGEEFLVRLSRQAKVILEQAMGDGERVFEGYAGNGFTGWANSKEELDARITQLNGGEEIPHWVHHDFRRTFMTHVQDQCKVPFSIADACIQHVGEARKGLAGVYNKATYRDEKLDAMQKWADYIDRLVHGERQLKAVG